MLPEETKKKIDEYTQLYPVPSHADVDIPFNCFVWGKTPEEFNYWMKEQAKVIKKLPFPEEIFRDALLKIYTCDVPVNSNTIGVVTALREIAELALKKGGVL
jgi:hypothetical protein